MRNYSQENASFKRNGLSESFEAYCTRLERRAPGILFIQGVDRVREWWRAFGRAALGEHHFMWTNEDGGRGAEVVECPREDWIAAGMPIVNPEEENEPSSERPHLSRRAQRRAQRDARTRGGFGR